MKKTFQQYFNYYKVNFTQTQYVVSRIYIQTLQFNMEKQEKSNSFSSTTQSTSTLKLEKTKAISLQELAKQQLPEILDQKFIKHHRHELKSYLFQFKLTDKIIKSLHQFLHIESQLSKKYVNKFPAIPIHKQSQITHENCQQILQFFFIFLNSLVENEAINNELVFKQFIQNLVPYQRRKMKIFKQLVMKKQPGGRHNQSYFSKTFGYYLNWSNRFFTISSEGVYYTDAVDNFTIKELVPFAYGFNLLYGQALTGSTYGIIINSANRVLNIDSGNIFNLVLFVYFLKKAMKDSDLLTINRYHSFADIRNNCKGSYYIDGKQYFADVCDFMQMAKRQIFITGWMISPYFCLKRPDLKQETRFDKIIQKMAKKGIKIHVLVYREPKMAFHMNSEFTENYLNSIHRNIRVLRHPSYMLIPFLWSHHQKIIIIDQTIAFMGGLDIGYGRWDDQDHRLADEKHQYWPGKDYCNYRLRDIMDPISYTQCQLDRTQQSRMPWHDIGVRIEGPSVTDLSRHFVQYWNYVNFQFKIDQRELLFYAGIDLSQQTTDHKQEHGKITKFSLPKFIKRASSKRKESPKKKIGRVKLAKSINIDIKDLKNQNQTYSSEEYEVVDDHQEEMEFYANNIKETTKAQKFDKLIKKYYPTKFFGKNQAQQQDVQLIANCGDASKICLGAQTHQIIRSASMWGLGLEYGQQEESIHNAYIDLINNAKQFIYIENQFFICIENGIANAIVQKIIEAYNQKRDFRVVIIIPSLPGFQGQLQDPSAVLLRTQIKYIYQTICRGTGSMFYKLAHIENLQRYLCFFNLRTHGMIAETPVTQIIYVHSKLMIIDDRVALIGSANINDRSLIKSRDSQIGIVIQDQKKLQIKTKDKKTRQVSQFAHSLRKKLYQQHFALTDEEAEDYMDHDIWYSVVEHADKNQKFYKKIFGCYPDDQITDAADFIRLKQEADINKYNAYKLLLKGNAVLFQKQFLKNMDLSIPMSCREYYVPTISFT